jgi:hypothetical protein
MTEHQQVTVTDDLAKQLAAGIAQSRSSTVLSTGGFDLLRMLKSGEWVFGQSDEPVQEGSRWVVNILSIRHGWCCWIEGEGNGANKLAGEELVPISDPKPPRPLPIEGKPFVELRTFVLACLDGDDVGHNVLYKVQSLGGMKAIDGLLQDIQRQLAIDPKHSCPILRLGNSYYEHKKWGRVYTPVLDRVGWADLNGKEGTSGTGGNGGAGGASVAAATPLPSSKPVRTRKAPLTGTADPDTLERRDAEQGQNAPPVTPKPSTTTRTPVTPPAAPARARKAPLTTAAPVAPPQPAPVQPTTAVRAGQRRRPAAS